MEWKKWKKKFFFNFSQRYRDRISFKEEKKKNEFP